MRGQGCNTIRSPKVTDASRRSDGYAQKTAREDPGRAAASASRDPLRRSQGRQNARRQSAEGVVREGPEPRKGPRRKNEFRTTRRRTHPAEGPKGARTRMGSPKGSDLYSDSTSGTCPYGRSDPCPSGAKRSSLESVRDALPTLPAYSPDTRSVRPVGWEGCPREGAPYPDRLPVR